MKKSLSIETKIVHGIEKIPSTDMDLVAPLHLTTAFKFKSADHGAGLFSGQDEGYIYSRISNPTVALLERKMDIVSDLENALLLIN